MSIHVIGNRKLVEAFELIGVRGHVPEEHQDVVELVSELAERQHADLVLIQSEWATALSEELLDQLASTFNCLVVEVPAVNHQPPAANIFASRIQKTVGAAM